MDDMERRATADAYIAIYGGGGGAHPMLVILMVFLVCAATAAITVCFKPERSVIKNTPGHERVVRLKRWNGNVEHRLEVWGCSGHCGYYDAGPYDMGGR